MTALAVLEELSAAGTIGVSPLARRLGLPKSTVQRALVTLAGAGWVRQDDRSRWALTLRCAVVGQRVMSRTTLTEVVRPLLVELRDATRETVRCFLVQAANIVLLDAAESDQAVRAVADELPGSLPLHASAIGRAVLAARAMPLGTDLPGPMPAPTSADPAPLEAELAVSRRRGWAEVRDESHPDVGAVAAVAAVGPDVLVGVEITYPLHRAAAPQNARFGEAARGGADQAARLIGPRLAF